MLSIVNPSKSNYELALAANPLCNRPIFQSSDVGEAEQLVEQTAGPHRLQVLNSRHSLATRFDGVFLKDIALLHVYYGPDVQVEPIHQKNFFFTQTTLRGHTEVKLGGRAMLTSDGRTAVVSPTIPYLMKMQQGSQRLVVMLDRQALENHLSCLIHREIREPLVFDLNMGRQQSAESIWLRTLSYLCLQHNDAHSLFERDEMQRQSSDMVMSLLLNLQPHNYSEYLQEDTRVQSPRHLRRAIAYIEENANKPLTVTDIASTVGVTARALQKSFQRHMEQTPAEYIRNLRLGRVHQALQKADGSQNVTEILLHHGVTSFGHFGRSYKQHYGVTPCETLRRTGATQLVSTNAALT